MRRRIRWFVLAIAFSPLAAHAGEGESPREIREIGVILNAVQQGSSLENAVIRGLDFRRTPVLWRNSMPRAVVLGCKFGGNDESLIVGRGAVVFPGFRNLAYDPYRSTLYTPAELFAARGGENGRSLDRRIYDQFVERGKHGPKRYRRPCAADSRPCDRPRAGEYLDIDGTGALRRKVVAIMGGHSSRRNDPCFKKVALLAWSLARRGYSVSTGGGPGMMEAGNLGAYLADYGKEAVEDAVLTLAKAPEGKSPGYCERVEEVLKKYPKGKDSLAVPTWFYGDEPSNPFGLHIAKYFSNAIREETLFPRRHAGSCSLPEVRAPRRKSS